MQRGLRGAAKVTHGKRLNYSLIVQLWDIAYVYRGICVWICVGLCRYLIIPELPITSLAILGALLPNGLGCNECIYVCVYIIHLELYQGQLSAENRGVRTTSFVYIMKLYLPPHYLFQRISDASFLLLYFCPTVLSPVRPIH